MRTDPSESIPETRAADAPRAETPSDVAQPSSNPTSRPLPPSWLSGLAAAPLPLLVLVFVGGVVSLGLEVSGPRLMAPYFGTTQLIWATQIGFTLIYLSIGYYIGGRVADRHPSARLLCTLTTIAAIAAALIPFVSRPFLEWSVSAFGSYDVGIFAAALVAVLLLFSVPTILLGMVSPFAVRLTVQQIGTTGSSAGSLYALSTIGSIIGAFLPALVLIYAWGVRGTIIALALALLLASLWGLRPRTRAAMTLPALVLLVLVPLFQEGMHGPLGALKPQPSLIYEQESRYNYIQVVHASDGANWLVLNEGNAIHSIYYPDRVLIGCPYGECWYSDYTLAAPYFNASFQPSRITKVAIIGLAGGTMAREWAAIYHPSRIDGAELDPDIISLSKKYFGLNEPNLHVYSGDGRTFMRATTQTYDALMVDAFQQPYMPFQLTTIEFDDEIRAHLSPQGVVVIKSGHCGSDYRLVQALVNTLYQAGFASVYTFDMAGSAFDTDIVATVAPTSVDTFRANLAAIPADSSMAAVAQEALAAVQVATAQKDGLYFTDDRAPVEQITDSLILNCVSHHG